MKRNSLIHIHMVYTYYWIIFFKNDKLKYTAHLKESNLILSRYFKLFFSHLISFQTLMHKGTSRDQNNLRHQHNLYCISHASIFCYVMYHILSEICIGGHSVANYFLCCTQKVISAVAGESLIPCSIIKTAAGTQNL